MSNRKSIFLLLTAIAVLVLAECLVRLCWKGARVASRDVLVEWPAHCSRIEIRRAGFPDTVLERTSGWRLTSPYAGSADDGAVSRVIDVLSQTPVGDRIADSELLRLGRTRADFALAEPRLSVVLSGRSGREEISFGAFAPSSNDVYAAVSGVDAVFAVPTGLLAAVDVPADRFRRRSIVTFAPDSVSSFGIKVGTSSVLTFVRAEDGWRFGEHKASATNIRKFLADLSEAVVSDFVWPVGASNETDHVTTSLLAGYGLELESAATVTFRNVDGSEHQLAFGKNADEKLAYALIQSNGAVVTVPADLRDRIVRASSSFADLRLFPVEAKAVSSLSIRDGDTTYALSADADGTWRLESPIVAPADAEQVRRMLDRILSLSSGAVAKDGLTVSLSTNAAPVVVARTAVLDDAGFECLRSKDMVHVDPARVRRIVRTSGAKDAKPSSVVFARDRGSWGVETTEGNSQVLASGIKTVLAALAPLKAERVERLKVTAAELDDYGLDKPYLTIAVDLDAENAVRRNVLVGGKTSGGRFATVGSSDAVFVLAEKTVKALASEILGR